MDILSPSRPCDVAIFGPLKTAYHEQVVRLFHGGAGMIGKARPTLVCSRARETALTARTFALASRKPASSH